MSTVFYTGFLMAPILPFIQEQKPLTASILHIYLDAEFVLSVNFCGSLHYGA